MLASLGVVHALHVVNQQFDIRFGASTKPGSVVTSLEADFSLTAATVNTGQALSYVKGAEDWHWARGRITEQLDCIVSEDFWASSASRCLSVENGFAAMTAFSCFETNFMDSLA